MTRSSALSFLVFNLTLALCAAGRRSNTTEGSHPNLHLAFIPANLHKLDGSTRSLHLTAEVVFVHLAGKNSYDQVVSSVAFRNAHLSEDLSHGSSTTSTDGTTRVEKSYKAEIYCDIRYSLYPFERPLCTLEITTANVTANEVKIGWIAEISNGPSWRLRRLETSWWIGLKLTIVPLNEPLRTQKQALSTRNSLA
ncbi:hypothetical protein L596_006054 [Steinernema carpocapsae]|uniref:Neurotransmitter-gated ion-channel ligand-binding domain-containing protein n=1 Tax=Steinernema carpocapsae TaxID=34508 RepID=A0A4U8V7X3_STECR|nr:hypothetical protein L596_006054 [Steinernema carpocapsae]